MNLVCTKTQVWLAAGAAVLVVAVLLVKKIWFPGVDDSYFQLDYQRVQNAPSHVLLLRPTHFAGSRRTGCFAVPVRSRSGKYDPQQVRMVGRNVTLAQVIATAYQCPLARVALPTYAATNRYDFLVTVTRKPVERFQSAVRSKLGYTAVWQERETEVLELKVRRPNAPGLRPSDDSTRQKTNYKAGKLEFQHAPIQTVIYMLEQVFKQPVLDKTDLSGSFDFSLEWRRSGGDEPMNKDSMNRSLDAMGLTLVSDSEQTTMMVVEKAK